MFIFENVFRMFLLLIVFKSFIYLLFIEVLFKGFLVVGSIFFKVLFVVCLWIVMLVVLFIIGNNWWRIDEKWDFYVYMMINWLKEIYLMEYFVILKILIFKFRYCSGK